jgi:hypothetical protein
MPVFDVRRLIHKGERATASSFTIVVDGETVPCTAEASGSGLGHFYVVIKYGYVPRLVSGHPDWSALKTQIGVHSPDGDGYHLEVGQKITYSWSSSRGRINIEAGTLTDFTV